MSQEYAVLKEENVRVPGAECQVSSERLNVREISHGAIPKGSHKIALEGKRLLLGICGCQGSKSAKVALIPRVEQKSKPIGKSGAMKIAGP